MAQWFYHVAGQQSGPADSRELRRLAKAGIVRPDTLVRKGASGRWVRAEKVRGLFQRSTPAPSSSPGATPPVPPPVPESGAPSRGVSGESPIRHGLGAVLVRSVNGPRDGEICALLMIAGMIYLCLSTESLSWKRLLFNGFLVIAWFVVSLIITIVINTLRGIYRYTPQVQPPPEPVRPASPPVPDSGTPRRGVSGESPICHGLRAAAVKEASEKPERIWPVTWVAIIAGSGTVLLLLWSLVFRGGGAPQQPAEKDQPLLAAAQSTESGPEEQEIDTNPHSYASRAGQSNSAHNRHSFVIGNSTFTVEKPMGFVLLEDPAVKAQVVHPADNRLHLVFVTQLDTARIKNGDTPDMDRYIAIQSNRKLDSKVITSTMFEEIKSMIRSEGFAEAIPRNLRKVNEFLWAKGQSVEGAIVIDFTETEDSYTTTGLVKPAGGEARVNTVTMRNLRGHCIVVASTALCRNQDDIDWSQSVAAECAESLR